MRVRIDLGDVTPHNVKQMQRLNQVVFPVHYNDKFYDDVKKPGALAQLAYFNDIVVGSVCARIENTNGKRKLYIMTLGCLSQYRRYGIGTKMLEYVFSLCDSRNKIDSIYLHVQISNEDAIAFYKKFGFEITEEVQSYYKRIDPPHAYILEKTVGPKDSSTANS